MNMGHMKLGLALCAVLAASSTLGGCGGIRDAIGVNKYPPDEFAVVAKAPLVIPPDFNLRPPGSNQPRPQEAEPSQAAMKALFPEANVAVLAPSPAEERLMQSSGGSASDRDVRSDLSPEPTVVRKGAFTEDLLYDNQVEGASGTTITRGDPERLRREEGTTSAPSEKRKSSSSSGGLF